MNLCLHLSDLFKPTITEFPSKSVEEYSSVVLSCNTQGSGIIQFKWYNGSSLVDGASRHEFAISNVTRWDVASYKCIVTNGVSGQQSSDSVTIDVRCKYSVIYCLLG